MKRLLIFLFIGCSLFGISGPYPLQFSIPEEKVVKEIPEKTQDFAFLVPRETNTYIYTNVYIYTNEFKS